MPPVTAARTVFVAGLSGAGKSQAMKTFEDLGFYCVEHLPPAVLDQTLAVLDGAGVENVAVTLDTQTTGGLDETITAIARAAAGRSASLLFLEARDDVLVRRFSETRRRHPLAAHGSLRDAIVEERRMLAPLREHAKVSLDTSTLTHGDLKERLAATYAPGERAPLSVTLVAFGFKYGLPLDLDLLFDVRFLRNPNYQDALRHLTGEDPEVGAFIETDEFYAPFFEKIVDMLRFLVPRYIAEGKTQLTIGIGCTGGRHRSVYVAHRLRDALGGDERLAVTLDRRDVKR